MNGGRAGEQANPATGIQSWDAAAASYQDTIERRTRFFVPALLDRLRSTEGARVVDVACGTGAVTLALARAGAAVLAVDYSPAMIARLEARMAEQGMHNSVDASVADATALEFPDGHAAAAVSNFGIIFCPAVDEAIAEMARVTGPEGVVAITAWTPMEENGLSHLVAMDTSSLGFDRPTPGGFAWPDVDSLRRSLVAADLTDIQIEDASGPGFRLDSWRAFRGLLKSPAFSSMFDGLTDEQAGAFEAAFLDQAHATHGDGPIEIPKRAWIASGRRR